MKRTQILITVIWATLASAAFGADCGHRWFHRGCGSCSLKVEKQTEKEECYEVGCQQICIPPVRFPWQKCHKQQCGRTRNVRVLKTEAHDVERCAYKWEVNDACPACGPAAAGCRCGLPTDETLHAPLGGPGADYFLPGMQ